MKRRNSGDTMRHQDNISLPESVIDTSRPGEIKGFCRTLSDYVSGLGFQILRGV